MLLTMATIGFAVGLGAPTSAAAQSCPPSSYALSLRALASPPVAELTLRVSSSTPGCPVPDALTDVVVGIVLGGERVAQVVHLQDVAAPAGAAMVPIGIVHRGDLVDANVLIAPGVALEAQTRALSRPDFVVSSVTVPGQILSGRSFAVVARIAERNGDLGGAVTVAASANGDVLASKLLVLGPGGAAVIDLPATLSRSGRTPLDVTVTATEPGETTLDNNHAGASVEVTDFQVVPDKPVGPLLAGYGAQFNQNVYAGITANEGVTAQNVRTMERAVLALRPQFSRIFFNPTAFSDPDLMRSFVRTVRFAQFTGTTINVTWQGGVLDVASGTVPKFAAVLTDLVQRQHITNLRWLTIQNEPNRTKMTPQQYEAQYRALDPYLMNIRGQVRYMGGDLVRGPDVGVPNQEQWFSYLATHMADLLDAYSIHVFWDYWDTVKLEQRLTEVRAIVDKLPEAGRKPVYVSEYGVRGLRTFAGTPAGDPGVWLDGTPVAQTNVAAFQQAWFDLLAARLGYVGASKWDLYFGRYDRAIQAYYLIGGPKTGWPHYPLYNLLYLLIGTVKPGWESIQIDSVPDTTRLVAAFAGPAGQRTVIGLDRAGAQLNDAGSPVVSYSIGGLPPSTPFRLIPWNESGDGLDGPATTATTDTAGVVTVDVPQHAVFALTTISGRTTPRGETRLLPTQPPDSGAQFD